MVAAVPSKIPTVRTDHGLPFTNRQRELYACPQLCARVCQASGIEPRLTTTNHPGTNGHVERMNRTRKDATVKQSSDQTHHPLNAHLQAFLMADHLAKRRKPLKGLTPESICPCGHTEPERGTRHPYHHTLGLST